MTVTHENGGWALLLAWRLLQKGGGGGAVLSNLGLAGKTARGARAGSGRTAQIGLWRLRAGRDGQMVLALSRLATKTQTPASTARRGTTSSNLRLSGSVEKAGVCC